MHPIFIRVFSAAGPSATGPLPVTFEAAVTALEQLPQMLVEPDGSFVWSSPPGITPGWQVDGTLVDGGPTLLYAELKGTCRVEELDRLLARLSGGSTNLAFEVVEQGIVLTESEFRRELALL